MISGCARLIELEQQLEQGQAPSGGLGPAGEPEPCADGEASGREVVGDDGCPGSFPRSACPEELPDLSGHSSLMAQVLRRDGSIYGRLKGQRTSFGVTLAACIKCGVDHPGHPVLMSVGVVAGDEECYDRFKELFDPIIECRHGSQLVGLRHPTDLAVGKIVDTEIDPLGRYAISARVRSCRSLGGFRLPPACDRAERREVERALARAFAGMRDEDLRGAYYPLRASTSYPSRPSGMSPEEEEELEERSFLFLEPDSSVVLSSGLGRDWPEARGVFAAQSQQMVAWINEEDHLRLTSLQAGGGLKQAFERFARAMESVESSLAAEGYKFARSERLGYIATCPSNLGTGLRASVLLRLPLLSRHPRFQETCCGLGLQAQSGLQPALGDPLEPGVCDVANRRRLGVSEAELVTAVIQGCARLVSMEQALERGEEL